ncbi:hypothetical protein JTE90_010941 [Oedothorax gibbosus]|uniref:Monocarboxylate transporter 9 n=1 Tax=Oedothorax gibbosus TaxID=931172 RepID=A0AAV6UBQ9_9ARAC|nr:hypothetical protein JTE90_010941 [Oedothorax gibbosus]
MKFTNAFRENIIVICSSLIYCIFVGTIRLNSQLFVVVRELFGVDREQASLPFTLLYSVRNLSGPFIGFIGNKFGLRRTIVLGCLLSSVSLAACFLVKDIIPFTILWGILLGIGFGLSTILIPKILQLYFTKYFNLVQGIFMSAGSIGTFAIPGIGEYLLLTYGTSGTFLILSGFVLHSVPLAMLLDCPETTPKIESHVEVQGKGELLELTKDITTMEEKNGSKYECRMNSEDIYSKKNYRCEYSNGGMIDISSFPNSNFDKDSTTHKDNRLNYTDSVVSQYKNAESSQNVPSKRNEHLTKHEIQNKVVSKDSNQYSMENLKFSFGKSYLNCHSKNLPQVLFNFISRNFKVYFDQAYILVCISQSFILIPVVALQTIMVDTWRDKGVTEDVTILMTFAIADLVGRLGFGFLSDLKCTSPLVIYSLTGGICGLLMIGFPWLHGFYAMVVFFAVVGALMGGMVVTPNGVIRDYIEKENLTMAFSSRTFLFGLLFLTQPSVIGYFRETLQSYDGLFYFMGSLCIFGIVIALFVPMAARCRDKRRNKKKKTVQRFVQNVR